jgi:RNA polymerase sigma-70 factor (ECF subfamily)
MLHEFDHQQAPSLSFRLDSETSDEELMTNIRNRDEAALTTLYRRHSPLLRTIISRVVNNDADTEELVEELFIEIWNCADRYSREKGKALGWMVTVARRRAIDRLRKKQAYSRAEERLRESVKCDSEATHPSTADEAGRHDTAGIFQRLIGTLPAAQQQAIQLAYYSGLSQRDIALRTGTPLGTIKTRLELAVRKLRAEILAIGGKAEWL